MLCGNPGTVLHAGLTDRLFGVPGSWTVQRCGTCRSLWLDPRPDEDDVHLAYRSYYTHGVDGTDEARAASGLTSTYERLADAYVRSTLGNERTLRNAVLGLPVRLWAGRRADAAFGAFFRPIRPGARLLDIGAASGLAVARLRRLGWDAQGIDVDAASVAVAQAAGLPVAQGDLQSQQYPDGYFSLVTMSHVIEHVHDPAGLMTECARILEPGGEVSIVTPNAESWMHRRYGGDWIGLDPPRHLQVFNRFSMTRLLTNAGLDPVTVETSVRGANVAAECRLAIRRRGRFDMTVRPPWGERLVAELLQQAEAVKRSLDADAGEDLVAIARRL